MPSDFADAHLKYCCFMEEICCKDFKFSFLNLLRNRELIIVLCFPQLSQRSICMACFHLLASVTRHHLCHCHIVRICLSIPYDLLTEDLCVPMPSKTNGLLTQ